MTESNKTIDIEVLRYLPEQDEKPFSQTYKVAYSDDWSVLQGLQYIKDDLDETLSFRWSCRMAICGSCGMMIDGVPKLACRTFLRDCHPGKVRIDALAHFPIERDLVVGVEGYVKRLEGIKPYLIPKEPRGLDQGEYLQTPQQLDRYHQFSGCINCMLCYAACPQYGMNEKFIGSGHMAILHRYNDDSRDGGREQRMESVNEADGVWGCTAIGYCSVVCPKQVDPAKAINMSLLQNSLTRSAAPHYRPY
ncbi:MAG: succinate dehydrogenase/fumarate reductase iron-sulfur subunit [Candidatus Dechloromonas phosphoritropha]